MFTMLHMANVEKHLSSAHSAQENFRRMSSLADSEVGLQHGMVRLLLCLLSAPHGKHDETPSAQENFCWMSSLAESEVGLQCCIIRRLLCLLSSTWQT
jgi:hypothetical protein